jgi:hypothetical protein
MITVQIISECEVGNPMSMGTASFDAFTDNGSRRAALPPAPGYPRRGPLILAERNAAHSANTRRTP